MMTVCGDIREIRRSPAGTIKLPFRKLNSISCEQVGGAASAVSSEVGGSRQENASRSVVRLSLPRSLPLGAGDLGRATGAGPNRKTEAMQLDDRSDQAQAEA